MPVNPPIDPSIIENAPAEAAPRLAAAPAQDSAQYLELFGKLAAQFEEAAAENQRLKGQVSSEQVKAQMMKPYANQVFWFVVGYCVVVGLMIVAAGFGVYGFHLSDTVLGIVAGSTAVSVIGLIGIVVSGLFGVAKS